MPNANVKASPTRPAPQEPTPETPASLAFPGRTVLTITEVANRLRLSDRHVIDLIDEGKLRALDMSGQHKGGRRHYRVPVEAYEAFIRERTI